MTIASQDTMRSAQMPSVEGMSRALLCAVYLAPIAVAVALPPAAGICHPQQAGARLAAFHH